MKSVVRWMAALAALGLAGALPTGTAGAGQPAPAREARPVAAQAAHGLVEMIGEALTEVTLSPDQETAVENLSTKVEPGQAGVDSAESNLLTALSDQVRTGAIDRDAIEPLVVAYVTAREQASPDLRDALQQLHALLDPGQRADFADALECRLHDVRRAILSGEKADELALRLGLDQQQKAQAQAILATENPGLEAERDALHRAVEAFRGDAFSLEALMPISEVPVRARLRAERIIDVTTALLEILDPNQRALLAARMREAALARSGGSEVHPAEAPAISPKGEEPLGSTADPLWVGAGVRRGAFGGVRGGVVVGGSAGFYGRRVRAYPYAAAWGYGYY